MLLSRRTKRLILGFSFLIVLALFLFVSAGRLISDARDRQRYADEQAELKPPPPNIHEVQRKTLNRTRRFFTSLEPWTESEIPAEVAGHVELTEIEPGQFVHKGDVLVKLESQRAKLRLDVTTFEAKEAVRLETEAKKLRKSNVVSETALQAATSNANVARAKYLEAQDNLGRHTIYAPFDGIINQRLVDLGEAVNVNQPIAEMVDLSRLRVIFYVTEDDLHAFPEGRELDLRLPSRPGLLLHPKVSFITRSADSATRLFEIQATLENSDTQLSGGLQGMLEANVATLKDALVVPSSAVRFSGKDARVLLDRGEAEPEWKTIRVGPEIEGFFPVFEGLTEGERILIR